MKVKKISSAEEIPIELGLFKRQHFREIFGRDWEAVFERSPLLAHGEEVLICEIDGEVAGWVQFQRDTYFVGFRNFAVLRAFRGRGIARRLLTELREIATEHHNMLIQTGQKPEDIRLMYLKSLLYMDADVQGEAFAFGKFLRKMGFEAHTYNRNVLSDEERAARDVYLSLHSDHIEDLKVFKMMVVDDGVELKAEAREELVKLNRDELAVVTHGLRVKLGNFKRSGRISYRYDICPICAAMGSSEQNDDACQQCFIFVTCMEPFRAIARFKEDHQVSARYFQAMRDFLEEHYGAA